MKTTEQKLRAISAIPRMDFVGDDGRVDWMDSMSMFLQATAKGTDDLNEKQVERIDAIFARFFED